jgi:hypothetical protein
MKSIIFFLFGVILLQDVLAQTQRIVEPRFYNWDKDSNSYITRSEFYEEFKSRFEFDSDARDQKGLDDDELYRITFNLLDSDRDSALNQIEWMYGYDYFFYGNSELLNFVALDIDGDEYIEYAEYFEQIDQSKFFIKWDNNKDGFISEQEFARGFFIVWDIDGNNLIDISEFVEFYKFYIDNN